MATCQDNRRSPATSRRNMGCTGKREGKRWVWRIGPYWSPMRLESTLERGRYSWRCAGPEYTSGASIRYLHRRFAPTCQLAAGMWRHHGGDGIDGRLLDSTVRPSGGARIKTLLSECPAHEERAGTAYGLVRMSVVSISAFRGFVAWGFPAGSGCLCDARSGAPRGWIGP